MNDLRTRSSAELHRLHSRIEAELKRREARERLGAQRKILAIASRHAINLADLAHTERQYRNPDNQWQFWNGRGRKPKWVQRWLAHGGCLEDLATS